MATHAAMLLLVALLCGALALSSGQIYPWGPETQWTRAEWPALRLPFPYERLRKTALDQDAELHSLNGPFSLAHHERAAAQQKAARAYAPGSKPPGDSRAALLRCTVCQMAVTSMWLTARDMLHRTGETPTQKQLAGLVSVACDQEVPATMRTLKGLYGNGGSSPGPAAAPAAGKGGGGGDMPRVKGTCRELLQGGEDGGGTLGALQRSLRQYAAQLNGQQRAAAGGDEGHGSCRDLHPECRKWAARGECQHNPLYMVGPLSRDGERHKAGHCRSACGICLAPLPSGELPAAAGAHAAAVRWLEDAQQHACNASGVCEGVEPGELPVVTLAPAGGKRVRPAPRWRKAEQAAGPRPPTAAAVGGGAGDAGGELRRLALALPRDQCFYTNTGWWTYEVCLERHVRQFHLDPQSVRLEQQLLLGSWAAEAQAAEPDGGGLLEPGLLPPGLQAPAEGLPYISQRYADGSPCQLEEQGSEIRREAEVRLACSPDEETRLAVHEPAQCRYLLVLLSPQLCPGGRGGAPRLEHGPGLEALNLLRQEL